MTYLRHIHSLNQHTPSHFIPFVVDAQPVGSLLPTFIEHLKQWPDVFLISNTLVTLNPALKDFQTRSQRLAEVSQDLVAQGIIAHWHNEPYPVTVGTRDNALFYIDRASAVYFGIHAFGQHLNGYVRKANNLYLWVATRAKDKVNEPGKLDHLVAGGLPWGLSLEENLIKECYEEAGIETELAKTAHSVGTITYCSQTPQGLKPDLLYCYDLELPQDFQPRCTDGEVQSFNLMPIEDVATLILNTDDFKRNCNLVIIDFMIRHGVIKADHPEYTLLSSGLHPALPTQTAPANKPITF